MARAEGIPVTWQEAPYAAAELSDEVLRLMSAEHGRLTSGWALADATGVGFTTRDQSLLDAQSPQGLLGARYPVTIEYGGPATPA